MMSPDLVNIDYREHSAFNFNDVHSFPLSLVECEATQFNELYNFVKTTGFKHEKPTKDKLEQDLCGLLENVFNIFLKNSTEKNTTIFYQELKNACKELLKADVHYYFRSRNWIEAGDQNRQKKLALTNQKYFFDQIDPVGFSIINELAKDLILDLEKNVQSGKVSRKDLTIASTKAMSKITKALNKIFEETGVLEAISFYHGTSVHINGCALVFSPDTTGWWKNLYDEYGVDTKATYFHFDGTLDYLKSIVYLTPTDATNGATGIVPYALESGDISPLKSIVGRVIRDIGGSPSSELFQYYQHKHPYSLNSENKRRHFMSLPIELQFNSHYGFDVIPGSHLETNLVNAEKLVTGPAGTFVVFDGSKVLHRGGLVKKGKRIALQIIFAEKKSFFQKVKNKIISCIR